MNVANSFGDIASGTIWGDVNNLILGFSIVFIYVNFMLGKFNHVEQRVSHSLNSWSPRIHMKVIGNFQRQCDIQCLQLSRGFRNSSSFQSNSLLTFSLIQGYLSLIGLGSVGMSIGFSYGFYSLIGLAYGPLHNMIPFLLLGIGRYH